MNQNMITFEKMNLNKNVLENISDFQNQKEKVCTLGHQRFV